MTPTEPPVAAGRLEPFFVHVGSFVSVIVYFVVLGRTSDPETGVGFSTSISGHPNGP